MNEQSGSRRIGSRVASGVKRLVTFLVVVALIALVGFLTSERNARQYALDVRADNLVVLKGRMLPFGMVPWQPADAAMKEAYAPIPLGGTRIESSMLQQKFEDRDDLDRALFRTLEQLARPMLSSDDPKELERGFSYLRRARRLPGISQDQRDALTRMESELAFYQARLKLDQARQLLGESLTHLEVAATGRNANARRANQLAARIGAPARQFNDLLHRALAELPLEEEPVEAEPIQPAPKPDTSQAADAGAAALDAGAAD